MLGDGSDDMLIHGNRKGAAAATAFLYGPMRIILGNGTEITPASALRQAILAVLLVGSAQGRARSSLQEMFWGSAAPKRASANLRTALYLLKRDLRSLGAGWLRSSRQSVGLAPWAISLAPPPDLAHAPRARFLEGLDLALEDCEGFEDWLREMRQQAECDLAEGVSPPASLPRGGRPIRTQGVRRLALGLLAPRCAGVSADDLIRVETVVDGLARSVALVTDIDIHDLRGRAEMVLPLPVETGRGSTHLLQAVVERRGRELLWHLRLHEAAGCRVTWVSEPFDAMSAQREEIVGAISDAVIQQMAAHPDDSDPADLFPWTALTGLFSLDADLIARTEATLDRVAREGGPPIFECLRLFAQIFKANEGLARVEMPRADQICEAIAAIPNAHPHLALSLSLAGYAAHMLAGENELAEAMICRAHELAPTLALNLDHMAVIRLMRGDLDGAETAFRQCLVAGRFSPWRYTYDVSGAIIAMARGDVRQTLFFANQALIRKPRFVGALRYAMLGFAMSEKARDAQSMKARIQRLRPDYDFESWAELMVRRSPADFSRRLSQGFQAAGV